MVISLCFKIIHFLQDFSFILSSWFSVLLLQPLSRGENRVFNFSSREFCLLAFLTFLVTRLFSNSHFLVTRIYFHVFCITAALFFILVTRICCFMLFSWREIDYPAGKFKIRTLFSRDEKCNVQILVARISVYMDLHFSLSIPFNKIHSE